MSANLRGTSDEKKTKPPLILADARNGEPAPSGNLAVGWNVAIWWKDDACFYKGQVQEYNPDSGRIASSNLT